MKKVKFLFNLLPIVWRKNKGNRLKKCWQVIREVNKATSIEAYKARTAYQSLVKIVTDVMNEPVDIGWKSQFDYDHRPVFKTQQDAQLFGEKFKNIYLQYLEGK